MTTNQSYGAHYGRAQHSKKESIRNNTLDLLVKKDSKNNIITQQNVAKTSRDGLYSQRMGLANGDHYHNAKRKNSSANLHKVKFRQDQLYNKHKAKISKPFIVSGRPGRTFSEFPKYIDEGEKGRPPITHQMFGNLTLLQINQCPALYPVKWLEKKKK